MRNRPQSPKLIKKPGVILWHTQIIPIPGGRDRKISGTSWPIRLSQFMTSTPNERASFIKLSDSNFDEHPRLTCSLHMLTHTHEHAPTHKCAHMNTCVHANTHTHIHIHVNHISSLLLLLSNQLNVYISGSVLDYR